MTDSADAAFRDFFRNERPDPWPWVEAMPRRARRRATRGAFTLALAVCFALGVGLAAVPTPAGPAARVEAKSPLVGATADGRRVVADVLPGR